MEIKAELNYLRIAPRKVRLVASLIRDMSVSRAELELRNLSKRSSEPVLKLLRSAIASATHNFELPKDGLFIKEIRVDPGPVFKRFQPRAFGRASAVRKRTSHIVLTLDTSNGAAGTGVRRRKESPLVREIAEAGPEVVNKQDEMAEKKDKRTEAPPRRAKPADFVRRVFRRKAI